jgi:tetratricopeptide (TPR) repeat protein
MLLTLSRHALLLLLVLLLCACPDRGPDPAVVAAEAARRAKEAKTLFIEAEARPVADKIALYRRILAFFPEAPDALLARMKLVFYLRDPVIDRPEEALREAEAFGLASPGDLRASECFRWLDSDAGTKLDTVMRGRVQVSWRKHLDAARAAASTLTPEEKMSLWLECADMERRSREPAKAIAYYTEALAFNAPRQDLVLRALFEKARVEIDDPKLHAAARADLEQALVLSRAGVKGPTVAELETHLARLN